MPITHLKFTDVGLFDEIEFEFDKHVNVFAGPNNSGKSTALMALGEIVVYPFTLPTKFIRKGNPTFEFDLEQGNQTKFYRGTFPIDMDISNTEELLETVGYTSFIPALRQSTDFRSKGPNTRQHQEFRIESDKPDLIKRRRLIKGDTNSLSDETIIQKIIELDYTAYRRKDPAIHGLIERIGTIASEITEGFPIQFLGIGEDKGGLFLQFKTPDGDIPLNVLSQGTQSILQWVAHLLIGYAEYYDYPPNLEEKPGILIIDEIDAHLHPSWQRRIFPTLTKYFPHLQFFCSTHSPLMLAGLKAGQVQLLHRDAQGKVTVTRNDVDIIGWSADEILRSFLEASDPTDLNTIDHIGRLEELSLREALSAEERDELEALRRTVSQDLLGGSIASEVNRLASLLNQARSETVAQEKKPAVAKTRPARRGKKAVPSTTSRKTTR